MRTGCGPSEFITDQEREDKLVRVQQGKYYGHPNPKRAVYFNDPRQCVWRNPTEPSSAVYESPLSMQLSSAGGLMEYTGEYFGKQLRGNLLHTKYKSSIRRTVLSPDGLSVNEFTKPALGLTGNGGLDLAQAPNGNLIEIRYNSGQIWCQRPIELATTALKVYTVFPTRGGLAGGTRLRLYGANFGTSPTVKVGSSNCPIVVGTLTNNYLECTLPGGTGTVDVAVTVAGSTVYTFERGYRYIQGF
jgi:large repetitive protein